ncbi:MAG: heme-binding protein [Bacteroidetes bacterium]|nr:heme-binding protein [Bacteroidota bacterium]
MAETTQENVLRQIVLPAFSNRTAFEMGQKICELAQSRNQKIAVEIARLTHPVFLFVDDTLPADKQNWIRRKANVAKRFEESSLAVKLDLAAGKMTLEKTFGLDEKDYLAKGGSIPVFVRQAGMVATITVSGLHDEADHQLILDALRGSWL